MTKIVSIHSFRGGTGKSNLSANLASLLAMAGKRVAVFDTDIQSPGVHVLFGLDEKSMGHTLNEYMRGECKMTDVAVNVGEKPGSKAGQQKLAGKDMFLIPSSMNVEEISRILKEGYKFDSLMEGIKDARKDLNLDFLIIDTHPGLNEETLMSVYISDYVLLIVRPDNQDIQGTAVTIKLAKSLDVQGLSLVVNKALLSRYDKKQVQNEVQDTLKEKVVAVLPLSEDIVDNSSSDLFALAEPGHEWSKGVQQIADTLLAELE